MGHTNSTANLNLPQFIGSDKPTWLGDINGAFSDIDAYVGTNDAAVAAATSDASSAVAQAASAVSTANAANTTAGNASTAATNAVGTANNAMSLVNQTNVKIGTLAELTTTDKTSIVNAINEVNGKDAGNIAYDNLGSGLTATNVQDAIDEVAQGGGGGNSNIDVVYTHNSTSLAAGDISITTAETYQGFIFVSDAGAHYGAIGSTCAMFNTQMANNILRDLKRTVSAITATATGYTFTFTGGEFVDYSTYGSAGVSTTANNVQIPFVILGIK